MTTLDDLKYLNTPKGFEPGIEWDGDTGHVTVIAKDGKQPEKAQIDKVLDTSPFLNSEEIEVDWSARPRVSIQHDSDGNLIQAWYKLPLKRRRGTVADVGMIREHIHNTPAPRETTTSWRTIQIADTHIGKSVGDGAGTEYLIKKWKQSITYALNCDNRAGVHLAFLGDLIEGEVSQGGKGVATNDLFLQDQINVAAGMVAWTIDQALAMGTEVIVSAVPGNHGEISRQFFRPLRDSYDIGIVASVQREFRRDPNNDRLTFYYPEEYAHHVTYQVGCTVFTAVHGHMFKGQMSGAEKWWAGMATNKLAPGAANVLMAGHFHNMQIANFTADKWIMFSPALEKRSTWFNEQTGKTSTAGMLVYDTINGTPFNIGVV